ncbi:hypothetical protein I4U23_025762 [Adineta vaga]|nr:hypothetical protein I4U23_025762 [Adineta vaga]
MIIRFSIVFYTLLLILINNDFNNAKTINIVEHKSNDIVTNQSWQTTTEQTLIRITRLNPSFEETEQKIRVRRGNYDSDDILGMAKTVAISVFVLISLCIVCCIVTTIYICFKCCCGGDNGRKRNQGFQTVAQPIIIQTSPGHYQPQVYQHQAPSPQPPFPAQQTWALENHPMLPQPSAPPQPIDDFHMERPPPYEKICGNT